MDDGEVSSPTVLMESVMLTAALEAKEGRDVGTVDIPNAFIQTEVAETDEDGDKIIKMLSYFRSKNYLSTTIIRNNHYSSETT